MYIFIVCGLLQFPFPATAGAAGQCWDLNTTLNKNQGSRIRSVRILFSERYVRTLTYSVLAYVNKNRIRKQTMITEAANWFFATVLI